MHNGMNYQLQTATTQTATFIGQDLIGNSLQSCEEMIVVLNVTSADRDDSDETYDIYITTGANNAKWDLVHFPQVATTGAKQYVARVQGRLLPQQVTTASPGVASNESATLRTDASGANHTQTLAAGVVRHGVIGDRIGHELVVAGTTPSITYKIDIIYR